MNVEHFQEYLQYSSYCGIQLTPKQAALIENSLIILQSENKFRDIFFWGRIDAIENDYYIAFGYRNDCLCGRIFFYSINCYQWFLLPPSTAELYQTCLLIPDQFTGNVSTYSDVLMDPKFIVDANEIVRAGKREKRTIKEEHRLACIVHMITEESALIPRGALFKHTDGLTVYNRLFHGFSHLQAIEMDNYQMFRVPKNKWNSNLLKKQDYNYATDLFDTANDIVPEKKTFSITLDNDQLIVFVKSLYWPGMIMFHKCLSDRHGFCYFGNGRKNMDLLFMI